MSGPNGPVVAPDIPEGYSLRPAVTLSAETCQRVPASQWRRQLQALMDAGADRQWVTPAESPFTGGDAGALLSRGCLLIAVKGSAKLYLLTQRGIDVAGGAR